MQLTKDTRLSRIPFMLAVIAIAAVAAFGQSGGLKGRVRNTSGRGISQATVTVRQNGADVKSSTANDKGDFVLNGLDNGTYNLVFEARGYSSGVLYNVEVRKNKIGDLGERLILAPDQGSLVIIKGSIFFKEGTSVVGAKIDLERVDTDGSVRKVASTMTNLSGEFTFKQPEGAAKMRVTVRYNSAVSSKEIEVSEPAIYRMAITLNASRSDK
ncbi:MAG: carboxypeptidase-like regulatory domain-containing protein [Acidobacteriota bacterium]